MYKKYQAEAVALTQHILVEYWQKNLEPFISHMHEHILWIGSMDEEYIYGADAILNRLRKNTNAMPPVFLDCEEYRVVQNEGNTCVVAGRYRAFTKPESGVLLSEKQRITFVWEKINSGTHYELKIKHIHLSNTLHIQGEDELFPTRAGKDNYDYLLKLLAERSRNEVICVKNDKKVQCMINYSDIMYIKADNNYFCLYMNSEQKKTRVRGKISEFVEKLPAGFIVVNRSLVVNRSYIKEISGQELLMIDGETCHMSAAVRAKVNRQLTNM